MNATLERWKQLHKRKVCGETLTEAERTFYEAEMARMDAEENYDGRLLELKRLRDDLLATEQENTELRSRIERNRQKIAAMEAALPRRAGSAKGRVTIADDFDAPLEQFTEYME